MRTRTQPGMSSPPGGSLEAVAYGLLEPRCSRAGSPPPGRRSPSAVCAEDDALDVVQSDGLTDMVWVENEAGSSTYGDLFDRTSRLSLAPRDSVTLIDSLRKET